MKTIKTIIFLFLIVPLSALGQLKGEFCYSDNLKSECFTFMDSSRFEYYYFGCNRGGNTEGLFDYNKDELTLKFKWDSIKFSEHYNIDTIKNNADSIFLNISTFDFKSNTPTNFSFVVLFFQDDTLSFEDDNFNGKIKIRLKKTDSIFQLKLLSFSNKDFVLNMSGDNSYNLRVYLDNNYVNNFKNGLIEVYKVKKRRRNSITLKSKDYHTNWIKYTKTKN